MFPENVTGIKKACLVFALCAITVWPQQLCAAVAGSKHDFREAGGGFPVAGVTEICAPCHVPHRPVLNVPLWGHSLSSYTYALYNRNPDYAGGHSSAYDASPSGFDGPDSYKSKLCLSCHDGSVAAASSVKIPVTSENWILWNNGAPVTGPSADNNGLMGSHPIGVSYSAIESIHPGAYPPPKGKPVDCTKCHDSRTGLNLQGGTIQCTTCHNPHNKFRKMLVGSNENSVLCKTCHIR